MKKVVKSEDMGKAIFLLQPSRPMFCTSKNEDGSDHVAPFSWVMPISCAPPKVALALQNERGAKLSQTLVNILRQREFVVNMPIKGQEEQLVMASYLQGSHACKFDRTGYTRAFSAQVEPVQIAECIANVECRVFNVVETGGDHTLLLADVVSAAYEEGLYDEGLCPNVPDVLPLVNLKEFRFDDKQVHQFIDTSYVYEVSVPYEAPLSELLKEGN